MDEAELLRFMRAHRYAVQSSVSHSGAPQAAVVGVAVSDGFELIFDTLDSTRKVANLRSNRRVAFVIGGCAGGDKRSVQYEGEVDFPSGAELARIQNVYFSVFPDGRTRLAWPGITYVRVRPVWIRYSDFRHDQPEVYEQGFVSYWSRCQCC